MNRMRIFAVVVLTILWLLLWSDLTPILVAGGILVSAAQGVGRLC
mgnify:CR=1 FL=1